MLLPYQIPYFENQKAFFPLREQNWAFIDINWYKYKNSQLVLTVGNELGSVFALSIYFYNIYSY